jgi:transposase-like protein
MAKQQPSYSKEFRQEAVSIVEISGKGKSAVARDLGIDFQCFM